MMTSEEMSGEVAVTAQPGSAAAHGEETPGDDIGPAGLTGQAANADNGGPDGQADGARDAGRSRDPWFEPEPKKAQPDEPELAAQEHAAHTGGGPGDRQKEWFLPAGRAGLLPESITESWNDEAEQVPSHPEAAGAPPWAGEEPARTAISPPPWESGPWPGPGEAATGGGAPAQGAPAGRAAANGGPSRIGYTAGAARQASQSAADQPAGGGSPGQAASWQAPTAVVAGFVPLVVPGLVLGILGLRRAGQAGTGRLAYWAAIGLSVAWAVIIAVLIAGGSGSPGGGCVGYPASVRAGYAKVMSDIAGKAPAAAQAADLAAAASKANSAAADTAQIPVRAALFRMASDMRQVQEDVVSSRPVPAYVLTSLRSDGTAFPHSCPG